MTGSTTPRLALGPVQFHWSYEKLLEFYGDMVDTGIDIVYLGETVCSKRRELRHEDWLAIAARMREAGKEVVLSTMALIEAGSELGYVRKLCDNGEYIVEANDMSAVQMLAGRTPFIGGATLNVQNQRALNKLAALGMQRWVAPVEATGDLVSQLRSSVSTEVEFEALGWGSMPLAYSARCFTARARGLTKDDCGNCCIEFPEGLRLSTQDEEEFLLINGIQTMSSKSLCNAAELLAPGSNVDIVRISPQASGTSDVIGIFDDLRQQRRPADGAWQTLSRYATGGLCNGYWHAGAGMTSQ